MRKAGLGRRLRCLPNDSPAEPASPATGAASEDLVIPGPAEDEILQVTRQARSEHLIFAVFS